MAWVKVGRSPEHRRWAKGPTGSHLLTVFLFLDDGVHTGTREPARTPRFISYIFQIFFVFFISYIFQIFFVFFVDFVFLVYFKFRVHFVYQVENGTEVTRYPR